MSRYVLITGASRGLGQFLARRVWEVGYSLCLVARRENDLRRVIDLLPAKSEQQSICLTADLAIAESVIDLISQVKKQLPYLHVLVNNAAIHGPIGALWENDLSEWQTAMHVNLFAVVRLCHALVPWMQETGGGSIINLSGGGATGPRANFSAYGTAKAALVRFSETLAEEVRPLGIRVNCIAPGAMQTELLAEVLQKGPQAAGEREFAIAKKVFEAGGASLEQVADLALFLASDASAGITGKLISAVWDNWEHFPEHLNELSASDVYTLRRITGRDRGLTWGDQ